MLRASVLALVASGLCASARADEAEDETAALAEARREGDPRRESRRKTGRRRLHFQGGGGRRDEVTGRAQEPYDARDARHESDEKGADELQRILPNCRITN